jgi:hypothetical protein
METHGDHQNIGKPRNGERGLGGLKSLVCSLQLLMATAAWPTKELGDLLCQCLFTCNIVANTFSPRRIDFPFFKNFYII